jgi:formiminotetrahydrofolate cyclodeaminase
MKKKLKQHHHFVLNLKKVEDEDAKVYPLTVSRTIKQSNLSDEEKEEYRNQLRTSLTTNRKFIKDLRAAKKPMMIHEKLMEEKWELHAASMEKIRSHVRRGLPIVQEGDEIETTTVDEESIEQA